MKKAEFKRIFKGLLKDSRDGYFGFEEIERDIVKSMPAILPKELKKGAMFTLKIIGKKLAEYKV